MAPRKYRDQLLAAAYALKDGGSDLDFLAVVDDLFGADYSSDEWRAVGGALDRRAWPNETRVETFMRLIRRHDAEEKVAASLHRQQG